MCSNTDEAKTFIDEFPSNLTDVDIGFGEGMIDDKKRLIVFLSTLSYLPSRCPSLDEQPPSFHQICNIKISIIRSISILIHVCLADTHGQLDQKKMNTH
jgi:hypothetical protein